MRKITSTISLASLLICCTLCGCSGMPASRQPRGDSTRQEIDQAKDLNAELRERAERKAYQERLRTGAR